MQLVVFLVKYINDIKYLNESYVKSSYGLQVTLASKFHQNLRPLALKADHSWKESKLAWFMVLCYCEQCIQI